ncbi:hypothetical protein P3T73_07645 [Kiritimatiellota bacterium B12222]|nr:hypothetical protein P3T73_07645 [Kiritimatiellota bacterium B12222]
MRTWFYKNLGDAMLARSTVDQIESLFLSTYKPSPYAKEMAVFIRHDAEGQLHCIVKVYFPPSLQALAKSVDARPCPKPSPHDLGLLVGSDEAKEYYFPT